MHVVVVEDAPELILLFSIILRREADLVVTTIGSHFETMTERVDWHTVDVALVDRFLGNGIDGSDLLCWLKEAHPSVRRIMLTGDYDVQAHEACAEQILRKPITAEPLLEAVRNG